MKKKYQSKILQAIHEDAAGIYKLGIISDAEMREYDMDCLVQEPAPAYTPVSSRSSSGGAKPAVGISAKSSGS